MQVCFLDEAGLHEDGSESFLTDELWDCSEVFGEICVLQWLNSVSPETQVFMDKTNKWNYKLTTILCRTKFLPAAHFFLSEEESNIVRKLSGEMAVDILYCQVHLQRNLKTNV